MLASCIVQSHTDYAHIRPYRTRTESVQSPYRVRTESVQSPYRVRTNKSRTDSVQLMYTAYFHMYQLVTTISSLSLL